MRLHNFEVFVDEFPIKNTGEPKIFISNLRILNNIAEVKKLDSSSKYYTTPTIAKNILSFFEKKCQTPIEDQLSINESQFHLLTPFKPVHLKLKAGPGMTVMACSSHEHSQEIIFLFEIEKKKSLYSGDCKDIRGILLNDVFANWVRRGIMRLYVNLEKSESRIGPYERFLVFENLIELLRKNKTGKIILIVDQYGHEEIVDEVARKLPLRVCVESSYYNRLFNIKYIQMDKKKANILVKTEFTRKQISTCQARKVPLVNLSNSNSSVDPTEMYINFNDQLPILPTLFELEIIVKLIRPKQIVDIQDRGDKQVPRCLIDLCKGKTAGDVFETSNVQAENVQKISAIKLNKRPILQYLDDNSDASN